MFARRVVTNITIMLYFPRSLNKFLSLLVDASPLCVFDDGQIKIKILFFENADW